MQTYTPPLGMDIAQATEHLVALAQEHKSPWKMTFNDINLYAFTDTDLHRLVVYYHDACERRSAAYRASPEGQAAAKPAEEASAQRAGRLADALRHAPEHMTLRDPDGWRQAQAANTDGYGGAVLIYAERWARCMEGAMGQETALEACAQELSHLADEEGITGFMYGCAVSLLAQCWVHGEALRCWHNLATQLNDEGQAANASGGVLNPALLTLGGADA